MKSQPCFFLCPHMVRRLSDLRTSAPIVTQRSIYCSTNLLLFLFPSPVNKIGNAYPTCIESLFCRTLESLITKWVQIPTTKVKLQAGLEGDHHLLVVAFGGVSIWPGSVSGVMVNLACSVECPCVRQLLVGLHG